MDLDGTLDGQLARTSYPAITASGNVESLRFDFGTGGELYLFGEEMLREEIELDAIGLLRMPAEGPDADTWFHAGAGTGVIADDSGYRFSLVSLARLGVCPGVPIAGEVRYDRSTGTLSGIRDEIPTGEDTSGEISSAAAAHKAHFYFERGVVLFVEVDGGEIASGHLVIPGEDGLDASAVYCIGSGSYSTDGESLLGGSYVMADISRLDARSEVGSAAAPLDGCYGLLEF